MSDQKDNDFIFTPEPNEFYIYLHKNVQSDRLSFKKAIAKSYKEFGMPWVEELITDILPSAYICPPLLTSSYYGNYFTEFDRWRNVRKMCNLQSFQGILIKNRGSFPSLLKIPNKDAITGWYGHKYKGNLVAILCIDHTLVQYLLGSFFHLVVSGADPISSLEAWLERESIALLMMVSADNTENYVPFREVISYPRSMFRLESEALNFFFGISKATDALRSVLSPSGGDNKEMKWIWSYCESMILHFLMGHEFGHYAFKEELQTYFEDIRLLSSLVRPERLDSTLEEEIFCDILGLENCLFQMEHFQIPPVFAVFVPFWILALVNGIVHMRVGSSTSSEKIKDRLMARMKSMSLYWVRRNKLEKLSAFGTAATKAFASLPPLGMSMGKIVAEVEPFQ